MANNKSTEKRIRQAEQARQRNRAVKGRVRTAVKELRGAVAAGESEKANSLLPAALRLIDKTAQKGVLHRNAASRTKSRLEKAVAGLE